MSGMGGDDASSPLSFSLRLSSHTLTLTAPLLVYGRIPRAQSRRLRRRRRNELRRCTSLTSTLSSGSIHGGLICCSFLHSLPRCSGAGSRTGAEAEEGDGRTTHTVSKDPTMSSHFFSDTNDNVRATSPALVLSPLGAVCGRPPPGRGASGGRAWQLLSGLSLLSLVCLVTQASVCFLVLGSWPLSPST